MHRSRTIILTLAVGLGSLGGCAGPPGSVAPEPSVVPSVDIPADATRISLAVPPDKKEGQFQQDGKPITELQVKAGIPYVFDVDNLGPRQHNFWIGAAEDLAAQQYDRLTGTHLWSGGRRSVVYTFEPGQKVQWACTLAGHYGLMHGDFIVAP